MRRVLVFFLFLAVGQLVLRFAPAISAGVDSESGFGFTAVGAVFDADLVEIMVVSLTIYVLRRLK